MESEKLNKNPNPSYNLPVAIYSDIATHACSTRMQANILHMLPMQNVIGHNRSVMVYSTFNPIFCQETGQNVLPQHYCFNSELQSS